MTWTSRAKPFRTMRFWARLWLRLYLFREREQVQLTLLMFSAFALLDLRKVWNVASSINAAAVSSLYRESIPMNPADAVVEILSGFLLYGSSLFWFLFTAIYLYNACAKKPRPDIRMLFGSATLYTLVLALKPFGLGYYEQNDYLSLSIAVLRILASSFTAVMAYVVLSHMQKQSASPQNGAGAEE